MHKYDDIINLPHHQSKTHNHMSLLDRAAQFSPFAALTGHEEAIEETSRLTENRIELDDDTKVELNRRLQYIVTNIQVQPQVEITYYVADSLKDGGKYVTKKDRVKKIDMYRRVIVMIDKSEINVDDIVEVELLDR